MTNRDFMDELKECAEYQVYVEILGEHGHGHYHTSAATDPTMC